MTRTQFLSAYRAELCQEPAWQEQPERFEQFMASVAASLSGRGGHWAPSTAIPERIWRAAGMRGRVTLKRLRGLPA